MEYNKNKIKEYVIENELNQKCRVRYLIDRRTYLYKYMRAVGKETFSGIGKVFNTHHSTVIHSINKYQDVYTDMDFIVNCSDLITEFPMVGDMADFRDSMSKNNKVMINLSSEEYLTLQSYRIDNMIYTNENAVKHMIANANNF